MTSPSQHGALALNDDGTFQIVPSEALRSEMARLETVALNRSQKLGYGIGIGLLVAGTATVGIGWYLGRVFGKLGTTLSSPRPIADVDLIREDGGRVALRLKGLESRQQNIQMGWNADEVLEQEANDFISLFNRVKSGNVDEPGQ